MSIHREHGRDNGTMGPQWDEPPKQSARLKTRRYWCSDCKTFAFAHARELEAHRRMFH